MSPVALVGAGCALALALTISTPATAQLLPGLPSLPLDPSISGIDVGDDGDVSVGLLGDGGTPITIDPGTLLGTDTPAITVTVPGDLSGGLPDLPGVPDLPDVPGVITTITEIAGAPPLPDLPGLPGYPDLPSFPGFPDFPDITGGDNPVIVNQPPNVFVFGDNEPPIVPGFDPDGPNVLVSDNPRLVLVPGGTTRAAVVSTGRNSSATGLNTRSSKLRTLLAVLQNRGWLRFAAGNGICLPPFAVAQVREMLTRREQGQLNEVLGSFANDIMTMRTMMANCRGGTRLTAGDINRVIGVGIASNGAPILYVL